MRKHIAIAFFAGIALAACGDTVFTAGPVRSAPSTDSAVSSFNPISQALLAGNQAPVANFSWSCNTSRVCTFNGSSSTDDVAISTYAWKIIGYVASGPAASRGYGSDGVYPATLTVTDASGLADTLTQSITVKLGVVTSGGVTAPPPNNAPTATISTPAAGASFVSGTPVSFSGSGTDPEDGALSGASLVWTSDIAGQIGTGTTFSTSGLAVGTHTITLTAKDAQNLTSAATRSITITAPAPTGNQPPVAGFTWSCTTALYCTFNGSISSDDAGITSYAWKIISYTASGVTAARGFGASGSFSTSLIVKDAAGLADTLVLNVAVAPGATGTTGTAPPPTNTAPTATITAPVNNLSAVSGTAVAFSGTGSDAQDGALSGASLVWTSSRDGQIGTGTSFSKSNLTIGTHTITLTAKDAQNLTGTATNTVVITAPPATGNQPPVANFTWSCNASLYCSVNGATSTDDVGITSYAWTIIGYTASGVTAGRAFGSPGTYPATLIVTDAGGLKDTITKNLAVTAGGLNSAPTAAIVTPLNNVYVPAGTAIVFSGTGTDPQDGVLTGASLVWTSSRDGQIGTGLTFTSTSLTTGTHTITLTAKDAQNATGTATRTVIVTSPAPPPGAGTVLFSENFESTNLALNGWYDNKTATLSTAEHIAGSTASQVFRWLPGAGTPVGGNAMRHKFTPTSTLYVSYHVKYSANWIGSGQNYHPHEFHALTNYDGDYQGPSASWLTVYLEHSFQQNGLRPRMSIQDNRAINRSMGAVPNNLTTLTEDRSVGGCNGMTEPGMVFECWAQGSSPTGYYNLKEMLGPVVASSTPGTPGYKGNWNFVEAYYQLNTIVNGIGQRDGIMRYWYNGALIMERTDVVFRTGLRSTMMFNQFIIAPYIGSGSPADQSMYIDNLTVKTAR